ncbi:MULTISPECIES: reverse transcriptase family protein [unclassified Exiguobacterium]|uniref:reverse transcriptase family protein n=1 Tax=unclassified Exiguobacterium TaxID=2644629 RepID=UPI001BECCE3B|nr:MULTISPECIES: reverse transcriptase family protein [unclassified Exiguobacterium]
MNYKNSNLYSVQSKAKLARLLNIDANKLRAVRENFSVDAFVVEINGKKRLLHNPSYCYKQILKRMLLLLYPIGAGDYVFGGIKNRDYIMNAKVHKNNTYFCLIDIKDFFPSTNSDFVYRFFRYKMNMSIDVAKICTLLTTVSNSETSRPDNLPQGFPTSPYLSYLSYLELFEQLNNISISKNMNFSCYYDDLTFSSPRFISKGTKRDIIKLINSYQLQVNSSKTRLLKNSNGVKVTGAVIRDNQLLTPNSLFLKLYKEYDNLLSEFYLNSFDQKKILNMCEVVDGILASVTRIELTENAEYIKNKVQIIRETSNATIS